VWGGVFICYRREDSGGYAARIYDRVAERLKPENVFFDVSNIRLGLDRVEAISARVAECDAFVAIIGRHWISAVHDDGRPRLKDPDDPVRVEIQAALKRKLPVIPILVDNAAMPKASELPESLEGLARRQGIVISPALFDEDVKKLTRALVSILEARPSREEAARDEREKREAAEEAEKAVRARQLAETEAAEQTRLGERFRDGNGVERDYVRALVYFLKAADEGYALAQHNIGSLCQYGWGVQQDYAQAMAWYRKAADQGDAAAQSNIGWLYQYGWGVQQDYAKAITWYRKAADQGYAAALYNIGWLYHNGWGVQQDYAQAMAWYRKAADQGHVGAQNNIGVLYKEGLGVNKDLEQAKMWLRKAADQGFHTAKANLKQVSGWRGWLP
jgi:TPR repeat protein